MSVFHGLLAGKIVQAELTGVGVGVGATGVGVGVGGTGVFVGVGVGTIGVGVRVGVAVRVGVRVGVGFFGPKSRASESDGVPSCRSWPIASAARTEASAPRGLMARISKQIRGL